MSFKLSSASLADIPLTQRLSVDLNFPTENPFKLIEKFFINRRKFIPWVADIDWHKRHLVQLLGWMGQNAGITIDLMGREQQKFKKSVDCKLIFRSFFFKMLWSISRDASERQKLRSSWPFPALSQTFVTLFRQIEHIRFQGVSIFRH